MDLYRRVELLLRIAVFFTFLGHGVVAVNGNPQWSIYLETLGLSKKLAMEMMLYIGILDIAVAVLTLLKPYKYVVLWAFVWAFSTALIRPISGESIWAFVERGSNWIVPLVLYLVLFKKKKTKKNSNFYKR